MMAPQGKDFAGFRWGVSIIYKNPPKVDGKSVRARLVKLAGFATVRYWRDYILPRHFQPGNRARYAYEPRTKGTEIRKRKAFGTGIDLVAEGKAYRTLTKGPFSIGGSSKRAHITIEGPWYLGVRATRKNESLGPDLKKEITSVTNDEIQEQAEYFHKTLDKLVKGAQRIVERKRIG